MPQPVGPKSDPDNLSDRFSDKLLRLGEVCVVLSITFVVLLMVTYGLFWLVWCDQQTRAIRLAGIAKVLNDNWKVSLLLLIPLFYRTIRVFLERVEEAWGMKAPRRPPPAGEKGDEILPSEAQKLPSGPDSGQST
jgi:hypothetical protein